MSKSKKKSKFAIDVAVMTELQRLGYLGTGDPSEDEYANAVRLYQSIHGLTVDGLVKTVTRRHMNNRFCGSPDILPIRADGGQYKYDTSKLPKNAHGVPTLKYYLKSLPSALNEDQWHEVYAWADKQWSSVLNLAFERVYHPDDAHNIISSGREDGPSGTLAWQEIPTGVEQQRPLNQKLDKDEPWGMFGERGKIPAAITVLHENGHWLGLLHDTKAGKDIMDPMLNADMRALSERDRARGVALYGKAKPKPGPTPTDPEDPLIKIGSRLTMTLEAVA